jgi:hypothetical protein
MLTRAFAKSAGSAAPCRDGVLVVASALASLGRAVDLFLQLDHLEFTPDGQLLEPFELREPVELLARCSASSFWDCTRLVPSRAAANTPGRAVSAVTGLASFAGLASVAGSCLLGCSTAFRPSEFVVCEGIWLPLELWQTLVELAVTRKLMRRTLRRKVSSMQVFPVQVPPAGFTLHGAGAPGRIRTCASASGGRRSIP